MFGDDHCFFESSEAHGTQLLPLEDILLDASEECLTEEDNQNIAIVDSSLHYNAFTLLIGEICDLIQMYI